MRRVISLPGRNRPGHWGRRTPFIKQFSPGRRVSLRLARRASLTVEAAFVLPLFFLAVVALILMMDMYATCARKTVALQEQAETLALAAFATGGADLPAIDLKDHWTYHPRFFPEALPGVTLTARGRVRPWTGRRNTPASEDAQEEGEMVYVSERATVYHTSSSCTHLALSVKSVSGSRVGSLRNHSGGRYHACEKCVGSGKTNRTVYVTEDGDRFHNHAECSSLTRSVRLVKKEDLEGLHPCSRCREREGAG